MIRPVRRRALYELIIDELKQYIRASHMKPGDRLPSEHELAKSLGVSRASLRQGLSVLAYMGLIESRQGDGMYLADTRSLDSIDQLSIVRISDRDDLLQLLEVRQLLERAIADMVIERASDEDLGALESMLMEREKHAKEKGQVLLQEDLDFHMQLAMCSGNRILAWVYRQVLSRWEKERRRFIKSVSSKEPAFECHWQITEALRSRDRSAAAQAVEEHLQGLRHILIGEIVGDGCPHSSADHT